MKISIKRRILSLLLALAMVLTMLPAALAEDDTSGTTAPGTENSGTDNSGTDSSGTGSSGTGSSGTDSSGADSSGTGSSGTGSSGTDSSGTGSSGTDSSGTGSSGTDSSGTDNPGTGSSGADNPGAEPPPTTSTGSIVTGFRLSSTKAWDSQSGDNYYLTLEPNSSASAGGSTRLTAVLEPVTDQTVQDLRIQWTPQNSSIVGVSNQENDTHVANLFGKEPGAETVTAHIVIEEGQDIKTVPDKKVHVTVSGVKLGDKLSKGLTLKERETVTITGGTKEGSDFVLYGNAAASGAVYNYSIVNQKNTISINPQGSSSQSSLTIEGRQAGSAVVHITCEGGGQKYEVEFPVTVESNDAVISYTGGCSASSPLKFSDLEQLITQEFQKSYSGGKLDSLTDLSVSTSQGTIYLGYKSPEEPGAGAGTHVTYYSSTASRGPRIADLTFVPKTSFTGDKAEISFTAQGTASDGGARTMKGRVVVTLTEEKSDLRISAKRETPLKLTSSQFGRICQQQTGSPLSYVIFTLPPSGEGTFYRDYKDEWNYAARLSADEQVAAKKLDEITFVPGPGFVGEVRIGYAGYSVSGVKYTGELIIEVQQGLNDSIMYNDNGKGSVNFSRSDFDNFCRNATGSNLQEIVFTPPGASQGMLYYNWTGSHGTAVTSADTYTPTQVSYLTFVPTAGFNGTVRIPFTATSISEKEIKGTVEIHVQSTSSTYREGDVTYICKPGESVKLAATDFANYCQAVTSQKLYYISFQDLPDFNQGSLYHNRTSANVMGTHVSRSAKYFNNASPYIMNLSFWAADHFTSVSIPFTGAAVTGATFSGVLVINSGDGAGGGTAAGVSYSTSGQNPVQFSGADFDNACRQATNSMLAYLRFDLPGSSQGILYYDYRAGSAAKTLDSSTALYLTGEVCVDKVFFISAKGFSGTVSVPYTGWAINGREFHGTAQIYVQAANAMGGLVRYESSGEPAYISAADIQTAAGGSPISIRLTELPPESQGKVYYQYQGPTKYSWMGNTTTVYSLYGDPSISNLTVVPKAGYFGDIEIPYTAINNNGTQSNGSIRVTVAAPINGSFVDMAGYSSQTKSAVEYLAAMGVVMGVGNGKYSPASSIRRGDFCLMLSRAFQFNVGSTAQGFSDVPSNAYYAGAVNEMYALGVVNGVGGGRFAPSSTITRQDAALMVQRALQQAGISAPDGNAAALAAYGDRGEIAGYAQGAVGGLAQLGIYPVNSGGALSPKAELTRADMALLLHRAMTQ